ncbi:MAG: FAD/NAD(P)-binding protein [Pseudomonadota bacterium]
MTDRSHAIVGDGITALAFLEGCLGRGHKDVTVIGKTASQLGRGIAYAKGEDGAPWRYAYLLNSPADDIDPDFATWLAERWDQIALTMAGRKPDWLAAAQPLIARGDLSGVNAPREFYGDYMETRAQKIIAALSAQGTDVHVVDDVAIKMSRANDALTLTSQQGRKFIFDTADIAPGGPTTMRFEGDDGPFSAPSVFGNEHRISEHINRGVEIFCIGGNAAMLDVLRLCQSHLDNADIKFAFCSPEGEVPPALVPRLPRRVTKPELSPGHATAQNFLAEIRREIDKAEASGEVRREIRAGFRDYFLKTPLHCFVSSASEAAKVSKVLRFWLRGGTRDTIFDMHKLVDAGNVRILQGRVLNVETQSSNPVVHIQDEHGETCAVETGFVVNCAGAGPGSSFDALTQDLLEQKLIEVVDGSALATAADCRLADPRLRYLSPAVTRIGQEAVAMPLYDAHMLRTYVARSVM